MKRLLLGLGAAAALLLFTALALLAALRPPRLAVPAPRDWLFPEVTLIEPGHAPRRVEALRTEHGVIAEIVDRQGTEGSVAEPHAMSAAVAAAPVEATGLAGLYVVPGLVDMHVHYPPRVAVGNAELWSLLFLAHGVTTVRETGSIDGSVFAVRAAIRRGEFPGPRIFACGEILDGDPPSFPTNRVVRTPAEARAAVEEQAGRGADCIKAYNMLSPEVLAAIRETAAALGLRVIGHAPHAVPFEEAGLADLQHGTGVVIVDPATVGLSDFRAADWATVDEARIAHAVQISLAQGIAHTPTLINTRLRPLLADPAGAAAFTRDDTGMRHLPRFWPAVWNLLWGPPYTRDDASGRAVYARFRARQAALAAALHAAGVQVHAGTDTLMPYVAPGSSLHGELGELVRAGIPPADVWRMATRDAGRWLGLHGLGTLQPGAPADLLFLSSDPRADLSALGRIEAVLAAGRLYRRADLERALARFDRHFHGPLYETTMAAVTRLLQGRFAPARGAGDGM
jgi:imidazolonepropionase-like amidohydrolase